MEKLMDAHFRGTDVVAEREQGSSARMIMKTAMVSARELSLDMWELNIILEPDATLSSVYLHTPNTKAIKFRTFQISIVTS